ncbi:MAG: Sulfur oxidation protein SoxY [uncultured Microvirga sp.]|uniref:Sulfur oxidation protein SoxY n=1 Tax=uncultured Microvirga sp. TaxID=412392 RepID=A0A6J4MFE9_9HYPH|nr:MAG: Sulfur oxidation protein SoxY [uncultured Microvirga sp.]
MKHRITLTRREALVGAGAAMAALQAGAAIAAAPTPFEDAIRGVVGEGAPETGRVKLDIPSLSENGNSVAVTVTVESPMTTADHVRAIYLFSEKNPFPDVARFHLNPRMGRAEVSTTIRLATSQRVAALAEMSDGSFFRDEKDVIVTLSACLDGG